MIPLGANADLGVLKESGSNTALSAGVTFGDTLRIRLAGDVSSQQQHLLAAAGIGFDQGYALIGLSQAREAITGFDQQKLKAHGLFTEAAWSVPAARILRAFVSARLDKASDRHLATDVTQSTAVTAQDLLQVIQSGNTTRYRTTTTTTTTVTTTTTDQTYRGGERQSMGGGVNLMLRDTTVANVGLNHQRLSLPGLPSQTTTQGTLGLTEYFPEARASASLGLAVGSQSQGRLALAALKALGNSAWLLNLNAYVDTRGENRQRGLYAGLAYQWGAEGASAYNPGAVPQAARQQLDDRMRRMSALSDGVRGVEWMGQVVKTESKTQQVTTEERVSERVVTEADAPAVEPPVVEPPSTPTPPVEPPVVSDPDLVVPAGSGWALLPPILTANVVNFGSSPVGPFAAGGLTDPNGRSIGYSATGLPAGVSIDPLTGAISGLNTLTGPSPLGQTFTDFVVQLRAAASGSAKALTKTVTLRLQVTCSPGGILLPDGTCF